MAGQTDKDQLAVIRIGQFQLDMVLSYRYRGNSTGPTYWHVLPRAVAARAASVCSIGG